MKKITLIGGLALALVVPGTAMAGPAPDHGDKRAAKQECKTLRGHTKATREGFRTQYKSFAACVKDKAAEEAQKELQAQYKALEIAFNRVPSAGTAEEKGKELAAKRKDLFNQFARSEAEGKLSFHAFVKQAVKEAVKDAVHEAQEAAR